MALHNLINSKESRLARMVIKNQKQQIEEVSWYTETKRMSDEYNITIDEVNNKTKNEWKICVKTKIHEKIEQQMKQKCEEMSKLRFLKQDKFEMKDYVKSEGVKKTSIIMNSRYDKIWL